MADDAWRPDRLAARLPALRERGRLLAATRAWFAARGYTEVETPCLVPVPGAEVHLMGFATEWDPFPMAGERRRLWLRTSPEFALKRLLAGGAGPVFELARVWRNGEASDRHAPEFTMLEWYRPGLSLAGLMDETEDYLRAMLAGTRGDPGGPFLRLTMAEAFARFAGCDLPASVDAAGQGDASGAGARGGEQRCARARAGRICSSACCSTAWSRRCRKDRGVFLSHWPAPQAALARRDPADPRVALRVEAFLGGMELANGFEELTDAAGAARPLRGGRRRACPPLSRARMAGGRRAALGAAADAGLFRASRSASIGW